MQVIQWSRAKGEKTPVRFAFTHLHDCIGNSLEKASRPSDKKNAWRVSNVRVALFSLHSLNAIESCQLESERRKREKERESKSKRGKQDEWGNERMSSWPDSTHVRLSPTVFLSLFFPSFNKMEGERSVCPCGLSEFGGREKREGLTPGRYYSLSLSLSLYLGFTLRASLCFV